MKDKFLLSLYILFSNFTKLCAYVFYGRFEVAGLEHLPQSGGILLCANHTSALADALIMQTAYPRRARPLARSGLFRRPLLRPLLAIQGAVPVYRQSKNNDDPERNSNSLKKCFEILAQGETLLIFPEGQSHSDPMLRPIKTGAARITLGTKRITQTTPTVIPVGINFAHPGMFRGGVLVEFGNPVNIAHDATDLDETHVKALTEDLRLAMKKITINAGSWEEYAGLKRLERFFQLRGGTYRKINLKQQFSILRRLQEYVSVIKHEHKDRVIALYNSLDEFDEFCRQLGVKDYHLTVKYSPSIIVYFIIRSLLFLIVVLPIAIWGLLNCCLPFMLTRFLARKVSKDRDQYDSAKIATGFLLFSVFWGIQIFLVYSYFSVGITFIYSLSLLIGATSAMILKKEKRRVVENLHAFLTFVRKRDLQPYLLKRRQELEDELAELSKLAQCIKDKHFSPDVGRR